MSLRREILSERTQALDRGAKRQIYARHGVAHYWIVDPGVRSLAEHVLQGSDYTLRGTYTAPSSFTPALFPELQINFARVFP